MTKKGKLDGLFVRAMLGVKEPGSEAEALYQRLWGASPLGFCDLLSRDVNEKGECWTSLPTLADRARTSISTLKRMRKEAVRLGGCTVERRVVDDERTGKKRKRTVYTVNPLIYQWGDSEETKAARANRTKTPSKRELDAGEGEFAMVGRDGNTVLLGKDK